jgi:hypothetical protein
MQSRSLRVPEGFLMTGDASELARQLAARRKRTTIVCEICGIEKEVWQREKQKPRTCSNACRQKLYRRERQVQKTDS